MRRLVTYWRSCTSSGRGRNRWYELSHDRFIQPILRANDSWRLRMQEAEKLRQEEEKRKLVRKTQLLWAGLIAPPWPWSSP